MTAADKPDRRGQLWQYQYKDATWIAMVTDSSGRNDSPHMVTMWNQTPHGMQRDWSVFEDDLTVYWKQLS